ncbi:PDCD2L [Bugula neritina]|uniref:PDCD2L n=1 Tax=Bugula neritina TaxID=10212 RepID=A0A7J7K452_BUGNE|nr:PDCD2L [Bugula neritina]
MFRRVAADNLKDGGNQSEKPTKDDHKVDASVTGRDTVPAYVADYLNSAPRDPLAAEESSRKASVRINEAAPRKHYLCQNEHCPYSCWQGLPLTFGPFRDRPARVGGDYMYLTNQMAPNYEGADYSNILSHLTTKAGYDSGAASNGQIYGASTHANRRPNKVIYRTDDLPDIYRSGGFAPFPPKKTKKTLNSQNVLPSIKHNNAMSSHLPRSFAEDGTTTKAVDGSLSEEGAFSLTVDVNTNKTSPFLGAQTTFTLVNGGNTSGEKVIVFDQHATKETGRDAEQTAQVNTDEEVTKDHGAYEYKDFSDGQEEGEGHISAAVTDENSQYIDSGVATGRESVGSASALFDGANELSASDRQYDGLSKPDGVVNGKLGTDSMLKNSNETDSHSDITDTPDIEDNLAKTLQHAVLVKSYRQNIKTPSPEPTTRTNQTPPLPPPNQTPPLPPQPPPPSSPPTLPSPKESVIASLPSAEKDNKDVPAFSKVPMELPPLPALPPIQQTSLETSSEAPQTKPLMFGISLASLEKSRESTDTNLTPSPKSIPSPDFDFYIVPRSPSPPESDSVSTLRLGATRRLSSKVITGTMSSLLIGFLDGKISDTEAIDSYTSKIGGKPMIYNGKAVSLKCRCCTVRDCTLVCQLYCPVDDEYHRTLYVFSCSNLSCYKTNLGWQVLRIQQPVSNVTASNKHEQPTKSAAFDIEWSVGDADDWGDSQENSECSWDDNSPYNTPPLNTREASETSRVDETRVYDLEHAVYGLSLGSSTDSLGFDSYYVSVSEEVIAQPKFSKQDRQLLDDYNLEDASLNNRKGGAATKSATNGEHYEKTHVAHGDTVFYKFMKALSKNPSQIIRYDYCGNPLPMTSIDTSSISACQNCGSQRVFEVQLMPSLMQSLTMNNQATHLDVGTLIIYSCSKSCWDGKTLVEHPIVQHDPDEALLDMKFQKR